MQNRARRSFAWRPEERTLCGLYLQERNNCDVPEETYVQPDMQLKQFFKVWKKRIQVADKAETRLPPSAVTRGRKRRVIRPAPLLPLAADSDYLVVDRAGPGVNCDEVLLNTPIQPVLPEEGS